MDAPELTVVIANHNTSQFLEVSLHAMRELTASSYLVLVNDDGSDRANLEALERLAADHPEVRVSHRRATRRGSYAHAEAVDYLTAQVETPYTAILDADCTPLLRAWDRHLIDQLDERVKIIGSTLGEGWSGNKPIDFPLPFLALWETAPYRRLGISAEPRDIEAGEDTCWQWRQKFRAAGYEGVTLESVNTRFAPRPPFEDVVCGIYYTHDGCLLGSHFGRGSNPAARGGRRGLFTRLRRTQGDRSAAWTDERDRWTTICREVIAAQSGRSPTPTASP